MNDSIPLLVLGLGNVLLGDDGVGAAAVARLEDDYEAPAGARVLDGGTLGLSLLPFVEDAEIVILVDAVRTGAAPGAFVRLEGDAVRSAAAARLSPHQLGVADVLDGARLHARYPSQVVLLGLEPKSIVLSFGLSEPVARGLPGLVAEVAAEAARHGFVFEPKRNRESSSACRGADVARLVGLS